jgi:hypothetical protein
MMLDLQLTMTFNGVSVIETGSGGGGSNATSSIKSFYANTLSTANVGGGTPTPSDITWDEVHKQDTEFTHSTSVDADEVTFGFDGEVTINYAIGVDGITNRTELIGDVYVDTGSGFALLDRGHSSNYCARNGTFDDGGISSGPIYLEVSAGDKVKVQASALVEASSNANIKPNETRICIIRTDNMAAGADGVDGNDGATGPTGSGANIIVQKDDVTIGTVTSTLNFEGTAISSSIDEGSNKTTITINSGSGGVGGSVTTLESFDANDGMFPSDNSAGGDSRNGHALITFDSATSESILFEGYMPEDYSGGSLNVDIWHAGDGITSGNVVWNASFETMSADLHDLDSDNFAPEQTVTDAVPSTDGQLSDATITFTQAQASSMIAGIPYRLKITRNASDGSDTAAADVQLFRTTVRQ